MTSREESATVQRRYARLQDSLPDARSRRVVFLSHCLLNQNTRYLGGAVCPGVAACVVARYVEDGIGIVQLPCPEQRAWGGVLKTRFLWVLNHPWVARAGPMLVRHAVPYLKYRYRRLARAIVDDVEDYVSAGFTVTGVVGVAGSPSCGVNTTLDLAAGLAAIAGHPPGAVSSGWLKENVIEPALRPGRGLFIEVLREEMDRRHLHVAVTEHTFPSPGIDTSQRDAAAASEGARRC